MRLGLHISAIVTPGRVLVAPTLTLVAAHATARLATLEGARRKGVLVDVEVGVSDGGRDSSQDGGSGAEQGKETHDGDSFEGRRVGVFFILVERDRDSCCVWRSVKLVSFVLRKSTRVFLDTTLFISRHSTLPKYSPEFTL